MTNKSTSSDQENRQLLGKAGSALQCPLSEDIISSIELFVALLCEYNEHTNLVSNGDHHVVVSEHVIDSLTLVPIIRKLSDPASKANKLVDIGSGAGFPAIVVALVLNDLHVVCIESVGKKTRFLESAVAALGLQNRVTIINNRAETMAHQSQWRGAFDFATARAVGRLDLVGELTLPFLHVRGNLLAQKSTQQLKDELPISQKALSMLGGRVIETIALEAAVLRRDLSVVVVEKARETPVAYPRPTAQLKRPLA